MGAAVQAVAQPLRTRGSSSLAGLLCLHSLLESVRFDASTPTLYTITVLPTYNTASFKGEFVRQPEQVAGGRSGRTQHHARRGESGREVGFLLASLQPPPRATEARLLCEQQQQHNQFTTQRATAMRAPRPGVRCCGCCCAQWRRTGGQLHSCAPESSPHTAQTVSVRPGAAYIAHPCFRGEGWCRRWTSLES